MAVSLYYLVAVLTESPVESFFLCYDNDPLQFDEVIAHTGIEDGVRISMQAAPVATEIQRFVDAHKALASAATIGECESAWELGAELGYPVLATMMDAVAARLKVLKAQAKLATAKAHRLKAEEKEATALEQLSMSQRQTEKARQAEAAAEAEVAMTLAQASVQVSGAEVASM